MVQKEVADRMQVGPGTKELRRIVSCGAVLCQTVYCGKCSANCFMPRPKVGSAVIRLERHEHPPVEVRDEKLMFG